MISLNYKASPDTQVSSFKLTGSKIAANVTILLNKLQMLVLVMALFLLVSPCSLATPTYSVLHTFGDVISTEPLLFDGAAPMGTLIQGSDGKFYGTTIGTGDHTGFAPRGTIFQLDTTGSTTSYKVLHYFSFNSLTGTYPDGGEPIAGLLQGSDGKLYGTTRYDGVFGFGTIFQLDISGATPSFTVLHDFSFTDGVLQETTLIQGSDGKLYGTTTAGGNGFGTVYSLDISGATPVYNVLHAFNGIDGNTPRGRLIQPSNTSSVCGTTIGGGLGGLGAGIIFCINTLGTPTLSVLYQFNFTSPYRDGANLWAGLTEGSDGKLYGMTSRLGAIDNNPIGAGTIFRLNTDTNPFSITVLHTFLPVTVNGSDYLDGNNPIAELIQGSDGKLYGTTRFGGIGSSASGSGGGTIFQLDISGPVPVFNVLHRFEAITTATYTNLTGYEPFAGLTQGTDGFFYGVATQGGGGDTIFGTPGVTYRLSVNNSTTTVLTSSTNPAFFGQDVTLSATVTGASPTGTVTFMDGATTLGTATLANGVASFSTASLTIGSHSITAAYGGDADDGASTSAALVEVINTNTIPSAGNDAFTIAHIGLNPVTVAAPGVLGNDSDVDGQTLTVVGATAATPRAITLTPTGGTVNLFADGHFTYIPSTAGFAGKRSFTYQVSDGLANSNPATVTLTIRRAPNAVNDTATTPQGQAVTINVLANDAAFGSTLNPSTLTIISQPANGSVSVNAGGSVLYAPNTSFGGIDTFTYTVSDNLGATSNVATVTILVPVAVADNYTFTSSTAATQTINRSGATGVLTNDQPIGRAGRTVSIVSDIARISGDGSATLSPLTLNANGSFSFVLSAPASATTGALRQASKRGVYQFTYTETLNGVITAPTTATITVQ